MLKPLERLVRLRHVLGLSQREMARELRVSPGAIGSWEAGGRMVPGPVLKLIEIIESEIWPSQSSLQKAERASEVLTKAFAEATRLEDFEIVEKLRHSMTHYLNQSLSKSELMSRVQTLALKNLVDGLSEAHGLPMKLAQMAAFLDPRMPQVVRTALDEAHLLGQAIPAATVEQILREDFGAEPQTLFSEFSKRPAVSASLGQVHRARLKSGEEVAVKIQYPEIKARLQSCFNDSQFVHQLTLFAGLDSVELLADLRETVLQECDYIRETEVQTQFGKFFSEQDGIVVPRIHQNLCSPRVITMEWIEGQTWGKFKTRASDEERSRAAATISRFYAKSLFTHGFMHADPHPGNYLFTGGRVAFLDYGRVKIFSVDIIQQLHRLHGALLRRDKTDTLAFVYDNSLFSTTENFDFEEFWAATINLTHHLRDSGVVPISPEQVTAHWQIIQDFAKRRALEVTPDFFWGFLFTHPLMIAGRADLNASSNWRENLIGNM